MEAEVEDVYTAYSKLNCHTRIMGVLKRRIIPLPESSFGSNSSEQRSFYCLMRQTRSGIGRELFGERGIGEMGIEETPIREMRIGIMKHNARIDDLSANVFSPVPIVTVLYRR